jgi:hypothetical protein
MPAEKYSAITADAITHLAIVAQEGATGIAFVDLTLSKGWSDHELLLSMPDLPDGDAWVTRVDPHGVTVGVLDGKPTAFLVNLSRTWIARIDLEKVATLTDNDFVAFSRMVSYILVPVPPPL